MNSFPCDSVFFIKTVFLCETFTLNDLSVNLCFTLPPGTLPPGTRIMSIIYASQTTSNLSSPSKVSQFDIAELRAEAADGFVKNQRELSVFQSST